MTGKDQPKNIAASVRQRLLNLSRASGEDFQVILLRFAIERLMYRLTCSTHTHRFVLKGAVLFSLWNDSPHRTTRDLDLWSRGDSSVTALEKIFREICSTSVEDDGLVFALDTIRGTEIRADDEYVGVRLQFLAELAGARIPMQVDIGFGDDIHPRPRVLAFPTLLPLPQPKLLAYPREAVVAEKCHAMVTRGITNSRMKDFYDIFVLARDFEFRGEELCLSLRSTFDRRQTPLPAVEPVALTAEFHEDPGKRVQWRAFLRKSLLAEIELSSVIEVLRPFLLPPLTAVAEARAFRQLWIQEKGWQHIP